MRVLFVDDTDTGRGPLAAAILRDRALRDGGPALAADSRGIRAVPGRPIAPEAILAARARGLPLAPRGSLALDRAAVDSAERILLMEERHRRDVAAIDPAKSPSCRLLSEYGNAAGAPRPAGIEAAHPPDRQRFEHLLARLALCVAGLREELTLPQEETYLREIERRVRELRQTPALLAPREVAMLEGWWRQGVPLWLALEGIEHAFGKGRRPRSILYCAREVEARAADLRAAGGGAGRPEPSAPGPNASVSADPGGERAAALQRLRDRGFPLTAARLAQEEEISDDLLATLRSEAPAPLLERLRRDAEDLLAGHRERMTPRAWEATVTRQIDRELRRHAGIDPP